MTSHPDEPQGGDSTSPRGQDQLIDRHFDTQLVHLGRHRDAFGGLVNPPIERGSTILHADSDDLFSGAKGPTYGRGGLQAQRALEEALAAIEGGVGAQCTPSGLAAVSLAILNVARAGDDILVTDSCYGPTRRFCEGLLPRFGVQVRFFPPRIGADIATYIRPNTRMIYLESPGSLSFDIHDVPAITAMARHHNILTLLDNTWSAGVFFKPFIHGVDYSIQAATKYQVGHADAFMGAVIAATPHLTRLLQDTARLMGNCVDPEACFLTLRGLRTLGLRLAAHEKNAMLIAQYLQRREDVIQVLYPALASHPDHAIWLRDFSGASGLMAFELPPTPKPALSAFYRAMRLFGHGFSWGGYESLAIPGDRDWTRTELDPENVTPNGPLVRLHIGLEHVADLMADLDGAFLARAQAMQETA